MRWPALALLPLPLVLTACAALPTHGPETRAVVVLPSCLVLCFGMATADATPLPAAPATAAGQPPGPDTRRD